MNKPRFLIYSAAIVALALLVREWFILTAWTPDPTRGDAAEYIRYAQHLVWDGVFSSAGNGQPATPDAYRGPGYPLLLAATMQDTGWFRAVFQLQALMGAATVACVIGLARQWLPRGWALLAGGWMALQPHHIAATGALLSEVVLGLCVAGGLLCAAVAARRRSTPLAALAGLVWGYGYLVNPVVLFVPFLMLPLFRPRQAVALGLAASLVIGGWALRNAAQGAKGSDRVAINLVQGSWPEYHDAWRYPFMFPMQNAAMAVETKAATDSLEVGVRTILIRMAKDPARYLHWYAVQKPWLLWDWDVRIGHGMVYTVRANDSPLDRGPLLGLTVIQYTLNPLVFMLAFVGLLLARHPAALMAAGFVVYVTAVHTVLQAEPRYATPYRSAEIVLAVSALAWLWSCVSERAGRRGEVDGVPANALG